MSNNYIDLSELSKKEPGKFVTWFCILIVSLCVFPPLFFILVFVLIIAKSRKKTDSYTSDHKTDIKGSGVGVRDEIIHHEKPIDYNKSTNDIYEELMNKKTDYSGVNKDLL